jgi:hypothetical protein
MQIQSKESQRQGIFNSQTTGQISRALSKFMELDEFNTQAGVVQRAAKGIAEVQARRGATALVGSLEVDFKTTQLSESEQGKVRAAVTKLKSGKAEDLLNLPEEDMKLLSQTNTGQALVQQRDVIKRITDLQGDQAMAAAASPEKKKELFKESMKGMAGVSEKQISELADTFVNRGGAAASQQAFTTFTSQLGGDVVTAGPAGGLRETDKGTGEEQLQLQTNINLQVLTALQALSAQLRAGR